MGRPEILPDLLAQRAQKTAERVALSVQTPPGAGTGAGAGADGASRHHLTFGEWERRSRAAASGLVSRKVGAGDPVCLLFDNARWLDAAVAYLAVLRAGAVAVPLGPRFPAMDTERILRHSGTAMVVCPPDLTLPEGAWTSVTVTELESARSTEALPPAAEAGDRAEILYPEGAMRRPVALVSTHADLMEIPAELPVVPGAFVHSFPFGTAAGQLAIRLPLQADGVVAVVPDVYDTSRFRALVTEERAPACGVTPAMATLLVRPRAGEDDDLRHLHNLVLSQTPGRPRLTEALADALPGAQVRCVTSPSPSARDDGDGDGDGETEVAPLAASQDGMVWHEQFTPGSFNLSPPVRRLRGPLDVAVLASALSEIVRRHAALRTRFSILDGRAVQVFPPARPLELPIVDISHLSEADRGTALGRIVSEARSRPFDLVATPPFEPLLVRLGPDDHVMVLRTHHAVYDDWSVGVFRRELSALYAAFLAGKPSPLADLPVRLPEALRAQARALENGIGATERAFWARELEGAPLSVQLPIDDPARPEGSPHRAPAPISLDVPSEVADALRRVARSQRATLFMVLLAGFGVLVQRYTGQDDVLVSTLAANRSGTELEGLIGCFGKKVLVRLRLAGDPEFGDLVVTTRRAVMGALAHQGLAYEGVLQEALGPDAAVHGLAPQVALKFQAAIPPRERLDLPGLTISGIDVSRPTAGAAHFMAGDEDSEVRGWGSGLYLGAFLGLSVVESRDGLRLTTEGVFHPPEVERLLSHLGVLLADIATEPSRPISELSVVAGAGAWLTGPTGGRPDVETVHEAFEEQARRSPDRPAVIFGEEGLTYAELGQHADELADRLRAAGVAPETAVGLVLQPGVDLVVGALGIWKSGGAIVPIDPSTPPELASEAFRECGCHVVVAGGDLPDTTTVSASGDGPALFGDLTTHGVVNSPKVIATRRTLAWIHNGAQTPPVEIEHGSLLSTAAALGSTVYPPEDEGLRVCAPGPATSGAFIRGLLALTRGHTVHLTPADPTGDPEAVVSLVDGGVVDVVDITPGDLAALLAHGLQAALDRRAARHDDPRPPEPVLLVASTKAMSPDLWPVWRHIRGARAHFLYGPPESGFAASTCSAPDAPVRSSIGRPTVDLRADVLDSRGQALPLRALGDLVVGGPAVARGYRNRPAMTAARFRPEEPLGAGGRVFRTGQRARRMPDGTIDLVGYPDEHVDLRGFLVDPTRIESALAGCPGLEAVEVLAREGRLLATVVARRGEIPPTLGRLRRWLWKRLPGYAWPATMTVAGATTPVDDEASDPVALLAAAWSDPPAGDHARPGRNYWQSFGFIDALAETTAAGVCVPGGRVTRNRTLETLATDLAATPPSQGGAASSK